MLHQAKIVAKRIEFPELSSRAIADMVGCSDRHVQRVFDRMGVRPPIVKGRAKVRYQIDRLGRAALRAGLTVEQIEAMAK